MKARPSGDTNMRSLFAGGRGVPKAPWEGTGEERVGLPCRPDPQPGGRDARAAGNGRLGKRQKALHAGHVSRVRKDKLNQGLATQG